MNITFFIGSLYGGGAERVTCNLANYLAQAGHRVEILTMAETGKSYELNEKVKVATLLPMAERKNSLHDDLIRVVRLHRYMKQHKEKNVYVVMLEKTILLMLMMRRATRAKIVASERSNPAQYSTGMQRMLRKYMGVADGLVFQTEDARSWYGESVKDVPSAVIPNAINPVFIRPRYDGPRANRIVTAGRLIPQKNQELLIRAFAGIAGDYPDLELVIYGEGGERAHLEAVVSELGMEKRVSLPGNTPNVADRLQDAGLFVLSSDHEGMPNALMEAMALGLPCVSTACPCGGPEFLIEEGVNGLLVPVGDQDAMEAAMRKVLDSEQLAEQLGKNAVQVSERLAPDKVYGEWEEFLEGCLHEVENCR